MCAEGRWFIHERLLCFAMFLFGRLHYQFFMMFLFFGKNKSHKSKVWIKDMDFVAWNWIILTNHRWYQNSKNPEKILCKYSSNPRNIEKYQVKKWINPVLIFYNNLSVCLVAHFVITSVCVLPDVQGFDVFKRISHGEL